MEPGAPKTERVLGLSTLRFQALWKEIKWNKGRGA